MDLLPNIPIVRGEIADYQLGNDGILYAYSKNMLRTVDNIRNNIALVKKITNHQKVPLLIYLTNSPIPDKKARQFSTEQLPNVYTAMAMVSKPGLSQFIMKMLFKLQTPPIPMQSFSSPTEAKIWLQKFV